MSARRSLLPTPYSADCSGIYAIVNRGNNKLYIGSAVHLRYRTNQHRHGLIHDKHHSRHLQRSFNRDPENFYVEILEELPSATKEKLLEREQFWINFYQSFDRKVGYNISPTARSCKGIKRSDEYRAAISKRQKGKPLTPAQLWARKHSKPRSKHRPWTEEHRMQMSIIKKAWKRPADLGAKISAGLKASPKKNKAVSQFDLDGNFIRSFRSAQDAELEFGRRLNIADACCGIRRQAGGFLWRYGLDKTPVVMREKKERSIPLGAQLHWRLDAR